MSSEVTFPELSENAIKILLKRGYLWEKADGSRETVEEMFMRVATVIGSAECKMGGSLAQATSVATKFYEAMRSLRFMPNTPTLVNAGRDRGQLAACYVLPLTDSMEGIMDTLKAQALVQKSGGGTGFNFGSIRERGSLIKSTGRQAAGPIPVIKFMNYMMTEFIIQGGMRDGANMGVLPASHPDIVEFIQFKEQDGSCRSFNVSISASDKFMEAVRDDLSWDLISVADGSIVKTISARYLFNLATDQAWRTGDPGMLFEDAANRSNPTPHLGRLSATNPCGEQWLLPNEACTLGHLNLSKYFIDVSRSGSEWSDHFNWDLFAADIELGVRFLDNVIEVNYYALFEIEKMHRQTNRKIGLGVMGLADLLIQLGIQYGSSKARDVAATIGAFYGLHADEASARLGQERGSFGAFVGSAVQAAGWAAMRNACRKTVAPTGTTAIIANCSTGIEPNFAFVLERLQAGMTMQEVHPLFQAFLDAKGDASTAILMDYFTNNTIFGSKNVDEYMAGVFCQANDVSVDDHIMMQATWQTYVDNSISKTINMPSDATVDDVRRAYLLAWTTGCKGITVYVDKSRAGQALSAKKQAITTLADELCPECKSTMEQASGCATCRHCGFSVCSISPS